MSQVEPRKERPMKRLISASLLAIALSACGHARLVSQTRTGGVYALEGDRNKAMEDAHGQMTAHCRGPYEIVSQGERVIGTDTAQANETYVAEDGTLVNQGGQSTREATEWRVEYTCTAAAPPPGPAQYSPAPPPPPEAQTPGVY
jgi:hypothetical protein